MDKSGIRLDHELIWGSIGLALGAMGLLFPVERVHLPCVFKTITGFPCPTCGMTRSLIAFRQFDVAGAFVANPLIAALAVCAGLYCLYAGFTVVFRTRRVRLAVTRSWEPAAIRVVAVAVFVFNWFYLIWVGR